jgi:energy-coupling factor transporter transmembrane protein EcfT
MKNINDKLIELDKQGKLMPLATIVAVVFLAASFFEFMFILGVVGCGFFGIYMLFLWDSRIKNSGNKDV